MSTTSLKISIRWTWIVLLAITGVTTSAQVDCLGVEGGSALPDTPCDDGLLTQNDTWSNSCECIGICYSDSGPSGPPGSMCNDGNPNTIGDVWDDACSCGGTGGWVDCEGMLGGFALPGTACDDGDGSTLNDVWSANCVCVGDGPTMAHQRAGPGMGVDLWPNPVADLLNVTVNVGAGTTSVAIVDMNGRVVSSMANVTVKGAAVILPVSDLADGLYTLRIGEGLKAHSQRFVKTH
jgi:hypothetical protein